MGKTELEQLEEAFLDQLKLLIHRCNTTTGDENIKNIIILFDYVKNTQCILEHMNMSGIKKALEKKAERMKQEIDNINVSCDDKFLFHQIIEQFLE